MKVESLNQNGVSITQTPGTENHVEYYDRGRKCVQYDYRDYDRKLFTAICPTLDECRAERDKWVASKTPKQ